MSIGDKTLDTGKLEQTIREGAGDGTIEVTSVDCPDDVEVASGTTFECRLLASDGTSAKVVVRQTDDDGNVTWRIVPDRKLLDTEKLETTIRAGIEEQTGAKVEGVDCPDSIALAKDGTFRCTANVEGGAMKVVEVVQNDDRGNVTWTVVDGS